MEIEDTTVNRGKHVLKFMVLFKGFPKAIESGERATDFRVSIKQRFEDIAIIGRKLIRSVSDLKIPRLPLTCSISLIGPCSNQ